MTIHLSRLAAVVLPETNLQADPLVPAFDVPVCIGSPFDRRYVCLVPSKSILIDVELVRRARGDASRVDERGLCAVYDCREGMYSGLELEEDCMRADTEDGFVGVCPDSSRVKVCAGLCYSFRLHRVRQLFLASSLPE